MFKQKSYLEIKIGDRSYQLIVDSDSPIQELIDILGIITKNAQKLLDESLKEKESLAEAEIING